jgi:hypothetical protein
MGVCSRAMLAAMISGERDPRRLAELAKGRLRVKNPHSFRHAPTASTSITPNSPTACSARSTTSLPAAPAQGHAIPDQCALSARQTDSLPLNVFKEIDDEPNRSLGPEQRLTLTTWLQTSHR